VPSSGDFPLDTPLEESFVMADPPGRLDTLETWEQWLKELREQVPDSAFNKQRLIKRAERVIAEKRGTPISSSAASGIGFAEEGDASRMAKSNAPGLYRRGASELERVIQSLIQQHREL
jgi:hypothetical protein